MSVEEMRELEKQRKANYRQRKIDTVLVQKKIGDSRRVTREGEERMEARHNLQVCVCMCVFVCIFLPVYLSAHIHIYIFAICYDKHLLHHYYLQHYCPYNHYYHCNYYIHLSSPLPSLILAYTIYTCNFFRKWCVSRNKRTPKFVHCRERTEVIWDV